MSGKGPHSEHQPGLVVITGICGKISGNKLINIWVQMQPNNPKTPTDCSFQKGVPHHKMSQKSLSTTFCEILLICRKKSSTTTSILMPVSQVNLDQPFPLVFSSICSRREQPLGTDFYRPDTLSVTQTNSVRALKELKSTKPNQRKAQTGLSFLHPPPDWLLKKGHCCLHACSLMTVAKYRMVTHKNPSDYTNTLPLSHS